MKNKSIVKCLNMVYDAVKSVADKTGYISTSDADLLRSIQIELSFY